MHRISQLEGERDAAVREAASVAGKAGAERETAVARQRELEDLKHERAAYQKDLTDMKASCSWCNYHSQCQLSFRWEYVIATHNQCIFILKAP